MSKVLFYRSIQNFRGRIGNLIFRQLPDGTTVLEWGDATRGEGDWWDFAYQTEGSTIQAEAWDAPKHMTMFVLG
jgi:hypothetical protein